MKSVVKTAKTVDEAVSLALSDLNSTKEDVIIEVLEEPSKGLFGIIGTKEAKVKVTLANDPINLAENFLYALFEKMNISGTLVIEKNENDLLIDVINISNSDMGILIGKRGNTLDSLQYILSLVVNKNREKYLRVLVDIQNYRAKREETLIRLANKMADKAKTYRRIIKLEPMNPYERRIIHSALQNDSGIRTFSEGEEPYRRVVIESKR
ncbi:spoIIIJ-associated protein [Proteiniborus ethanoligenes]|uniref:RNA-binding protein KhpB n=1 Tax=Proteiniborus ethanoligenes TaxID=415015 RepID=A0A1H3NKG3_9FIRM|nr:RNA-binding cell elongation regulator Jag/EloR [Proteiniborus ethanoligenes]TAH60027.1 MAG: protein jag [Gottschalkiaceae bacterium]SDY89437.1 spoIIIJ-associated protein [Proteiniborus ethanoligenes]